MVEQCDISQLKASSHFKKVYITSFEAIKIRFVGLIGWPT